MGIHAGEVKVYGILGRGEKELLIVDTNKRPQAKLVSEPNSTASDAKEDPKGTRDSKELKEAAATKVETPSQDVEVGKNGGDCRDATILNTNVDIIPDERTNSTVSDRSDLSIDTEATGCTIPDPEDANFPRTMEDVITPLSPVDAGSPHAFFAPKGRRPEGETLREALKSSIGQKEFHAPQPDSPTFARPASPKSRNASRTRQPEQQEPALIAHDLAKEEQITHRALGVQSPVQPHSAAAAPDRYISSFPASPFGPRSSHLTPRPKSTVW